MQREHYSSRPVEVPVSVYDIERQPFLPYASEDNCPEHLRPRLAALKQRMGYVPNSVRHYLHNGRILTAILGMTENILGAHPEATLPRVLKIKLALICSAINGCMYCMAHQCGFLTKPVSAAEEGWGLSAAEIDSLVDGTAQPANELEEICFEFARTASRSAAEVTDDLRSRMSRLLTPAQCMELAAVVGYWKFINTVHESLNFPVEERNLHLAQHLESLFSQRNDMSDRAEAAGSEKVVP